MHHSYPWMIRRAAMCVAAVLGLLLSGCGGGAEAEVRKTYGEYEKAIAANNLAAVKNLVVKAKRAELDQPGADAILGMIAQFRPTTATIVSVELGADGQAAQVKVKGDKDGTHMEGVADLHLEDGAWRLGNEAWTIVMGGDEGAGAPPDATYPPVNEKVAKLMDLIARNDVAVASKAWMDLAALYDYAPDYLKAAASGFNDDRPICFALEFEMGQGMDGKPSRYLTTHGTALADAKSPQAKTVGEALRAPLWGLEFQNETNMDQSFADWYAGYAQKKGL